METPKTRQSNSRDAFQASLDAGMPLRFAYDDGLAFLANTRTFVSGTDYVNEALQSMQTWPGLPDMDALASYRAQVEAQQPATTKSPAAVTYDCATGKCSDGSTPTLGWLD